MDNKSIFINKNTGECCYEINDNKSDYIKIIGSTLWSRINEHASTIMNDYRRIYRSKNKLITPNDTIKMYNSNKKYIIQEIEKDIDIPVILLTHHGVHELCNGDYNTNGSTFGSAYYTDFKELKKYKNIIACINGHTHSNINTVMPGTDIKLLSNCMGYPGEEESVVRYNNEAYIEI